MGQRIARDYAGKKPVLVGILRGAFVFMADLVRAIGIPVEIDFMAVESYGKKTYSSGVVRIVRDVSCSIEGRHVLLVEDIVDTGQTLSYLLKNLLTRGPASLKVCALLNKKERRIVPVPVEYVGFDVPDRFVVGYGLDYNQERRNLPYITVVNEVVERE